MRWLGRLTQHLSIKDLLHEKGYPNLNEEDLVRITEEIRALSEKEGRFVTEDEMINIAEREV